MVSPKSSPKSKPAWIPPCSPTVAKGIDWRDNAAHRARIIRRSLADFEATAKVKRKNTLWATAKQVRVEKERLSGMPAPTPWPALDPAATELSVPPVPGTRNREFTLFTELPAELRLLIWGFAAGLPKMVEIRFFGVPYDYPYVRYGNNHSIAAVCKESKEVVEGAGESASFRMRGGKKGLRNKYQPVNFNPERDTIFFRPLDSSDVSPNIWAEFSALSNIQHVALPIDQDPCLDPLDVLRRPTWWRLCQECVNLKSITLVLGSNETSWRTWRSIEARRVRDWGGEEGGGKGLVWERKRINVADLRGTMVAAWGAGLNGQWGYI